MRLLCCRGIEPEDDIGFYWQVLGICHVKLLHITPLAEKLLEQAKLACGRDRNDGFRGSNKGSEVIDQQFFDVGQVRRCDFLNQDLDFMWKVYILFDAVLSSSNKNHTESLWNHAKKSLLDTEPDNFDELSRFGHI